MSFWQFFKKGWDGLALLVQPLKSNRGNWKILFVLGSYEYLKRLKGKIRDGIFFVLKNQIITVWSALLCGKFLWATLILFVYPVWPWALNLMNLGMSCPNEMPFLYPRGPSIDYVVSKSVFALLPLVVFFIKNRVLG